MDLDTLSGFASSIPIDWFIIGAFVALFAIDILRSGAGRVSAVALALPATLFLMILVVQAVPLRDYVDQFSTPFLQAMLFLALFTGLYLLVRRIDSSSYADDHGQPMQALLGGCAGAAVLLVVWLELPALQTLWQFGGNVQAVFGEAYRFWWFLGGYAILAFIRS